MPRIEPDEAALKAAYNSRLTRPLSLEAMLSDPLQRIILTNEARAYLRRHQWQFDAQKVRLGEKDES
jgi:hypothetical protein